jgi:leader peptidase (prepilin peptidase)/N-methyltransferase
VTAQGVILAMMWVALMVMMVVDLEHYIIPDPIHIILIALGIGYHLLMDTPLLEVISGFALGGGIGLTLHHGYRWVRKREGLGFGDVKFLAVAGLWLGMKPIVPFLFFSGVFGIVTGLIWRALGRGRIFPFGPSLALALFFSVVFPEIANTFWNIGQLAH